MAEPAPPHRERFRVHSFDADVRGYLAPSALCAFMQEAAGHDASERGAGMKQLLGEGLAWMLQRLAVEVATWPGDGDEITVVTWPTSFGGAIAERLFTVEDGQGLRLAEAASRWALVDLRARRAVRLPDFLRSIAVPTRGVDVQIGPVPAAPKEAPLASHRLEVRRADLDLVGHANNTRYVEWGLEAVPDAWLEAHELGAFDVAFRREALRGDVLVSRSFLVRDNTLAHALLREKEGETVALLETRWRPR